MNETMVRDTITNNKELTQKKLNLHQLPIETLQIIVTFLIGNLDLNLNEIIEQYFKNNNSFHFELPSLQNVLTLISFTNLNKELLQKSDWIITFYKNCCNTLDFIYYYLLNEGKGREDIGQGDLTDYERIEINDIQNLILFSELGIVQENYNENEGNDEEENDKKKEDNENDRFCKDWYNLENAKKYFTKRMKLLLNKQRNETLQITINEEEEDYFISFLSKIFNLIEPIINTQSSYDYIDNTPKHVINYQSNSVIDFNDLDIMNNSSGYLGFLLDHDNSESLKEGLKEDKNENYFKLKKALQNVFYLAFTSTFNFWDCFRKDLTIFDNILILNINFDNCKIDLTDIVFRNVRYLIVCKDDDNYRYYNQSYNSDDDKILLNILQQKYFPKLNHLVLEGRQFNSELKECDALQNIEKLEIRCMDSDDFRNGNDIFNTLKNLLPYCPCLRFCIIPQYLLIQFSSSVSFEGVQNIYNLDDKNCVISIQNNSYNYYYERCWE
ncbi:hypothetical protein ABK040_015446 [Willaertia magna]